MSKHENWDREDSNLPDLWEASPEPEKQKKSHSFVKWGAVQQQPAEEEVIDLTALDEEDDERLVDIQSFIHSLVARLPEEHAPPLHLLDAVLSADVLEIDEANQLNLLPLLHFFEQHVGWSEHKFQTFCKPIVNHASTLNVGIIFQEAAIELEKLEDTESPLLEAIAANSEPIPIPTPQTFHETLSPEDTQEAISFLMHCIENSALKVMIKFEALESYLNEYLPSMWKNGALDLQPMWDELSDLPMVSEPLALSAFQEIDKRSSNFRLPVELPIKVKKDLAKKAAPSVAFREIDSQPQQKPKQNEIETPRGSRPENTLPEVVMVAIRKRTRPIFYVGFLVVMLVAYYKVFFGETRLQMKGKSLKLEVFSEYVPVKAVSMYMKNSSVYLMVKRDFLSWSGEKRIQAIYKVRKFTVKRLKARRLKILGPDGALYAEIGAQ